MHKRLTAKGKMLKRVAGTLMRHRVITTGVTLALQSVIFAVSLPKEEAKAFSHAVELVESSKLLDREPSLSNSLRLLCMGT
jgi:hypothetical protein